MNFSDVINYFELQSFSINNSKGGMNQEFLILGKVRKSSVTVFFAFTVLFVVWDMMSIFSNYFYSSLGSSFYMHTVDYHLSFLPLVLDLFAYLLVFWEHKLLFARLEKNKKIDFYQRQLPSNLKPAHVRMLMNDGLIDRISVGTTLMDLIDKGYLKIKEYEQDKDFFKSNDKAVLIKTNKDTKNLLKYEVFLIDWFINVCGDGNKVTKKELYDRLYDIDTTTTSNDRYNEFKSYVIVSYPFYKLYKNRLKSSKYKSFIAIIMIIAGFVAPFLSFFPLFVSAGFWAILGFGIIFFNNPSYTLNANGSIEINNWKALKKFLNEFTIIKERNVEMIELWSFYSTYSVALDENNIAKNEIINFFGENICVGNDAYLSNNKNNSNVMNLSNDKRKQIKQVVEEEKIKYSFKSFF